MNLLTPSCPIMKKNDESRRIARYIYAWFNEYLPTIKSYSSHTVRSYKTSLSLYVDYLKKVKKVKPQTFTALCFSLEYLEGWITWLKVERQCSPETCNIRLASLRSFLTYLGERDVAFLSLEHNAGAIPMQKTVTKKVSGLSRKAVKAVLAAPDLQTKIGRRDIAFMILMYSTAARISEVLSIKISHLCLRVERPYVTVIGKGNKIRTAYLLPKAVTYIEKYLKDYHTDKPNQDAYLFYSTHAGIMRKMTPDAINKRLKKYALIAHESCDEIPSSLHAHLFRHAKSFHWLEDGMNIVQISFLLGHAQLNTTMKYLDITTEQESKALATIEDEETRKIPKKWKNQENDLSGFLGLPQVAKG